MYLFYSNLVVERMSVKNKNQSDFRICKHFINFQIFLLLFYINFFEVCVLVEKLEFSMNICEVR